MALNLEHDGSGSSMNSTDTEMVIQAGTKKSSFWTGLFTEDRKTGDYFWALYKEVWALMVGFESAISWSTDKMFDEEVKILGENKITIGTDQATGQIMEAMMNIDSDAWGADPDATGIEYISPFFGFKGSGNKYERVRGYYDRITDEEENMIERKDSKRSGS